MRAPWYKTSSGMRLLGLEKKLLSSILPTLYGYHLLQIAPAEFLPCIKSSLILHCVNTQVHIKADHIALPLLSESIDVVVLNHTFEDTNRPDAPFMILNEAYRVLIPGGHIVITGLNFFNRWGMTMMMRGAPLISRHKVKTWLSLLECEIIASPSFSLASFFDPIYAVVAIKRVAPLTLIKPVWSEKEMPWAQEEGSY